MEFAEMINPTYDPTKNHVYEAFVDYFNNPTMYKIKNVKEFSMYIVKIYAMLGNAYRYLIAFVPRDFEPLGTKKLFQDCEWVSLQTRTLEDQHRIPAHSYTAGLIHPLDQKITVQDRSMERSLYKAEKFPLDITLLNTRKNHLHQYHPTGTIISALETFQTIITFNNGKK
jgi:hypothetical protein